MKLIVQKGDQQIETDQNWGKELRVNLSLMIENWIIGWSQDIMEGRDVESGSRVKGLPDNMFKAIE